MSTINKFEGATTTVGGHEAKKVRFNPIAKGYIGLVKDPLWQDNPVVIKNGGFASCQWTKGGKCINQTRPELNLVKPS